MAMDNYIWLLDRKSDSLFTWPFIMSLGLHLMLFAVLVIKPVYPLTGDTERLDSIWLYFNTQSPGQAPKPPPSQVVASPGDKSSGDIRKADIEQKPKEHTEKTVPPYVRTPLPEEITEPLQASTEAVTETEPVTELVVANEIRKKPEIQKAEKAKKHEPLPVMKKKSARERVEKAKPRESAEIKTLVAPDLKKDQAAVLEKVREPVEDKIAESSFPNISGAVKNRIAVPEKESVKTAWTDKSIEARTLGPDRSAEIKTSRPAAVPPGNTARPAHVAEARQAKNNVIQGGKHSAVATPGKEIKKTQRGVINSDPDLREIFSGFGAEELVENIKPAGLTVGPEPVPVAKVSGGNSGGKIASPQTKPVAKPENKGGAGKSADAKQSGPPVNDKVIAVPRLTGDLKIEIKGNTNLKITFAFREFLKPRRNRPMSAAEARRFVHIAPRIARPRENLLEAVLGTTGEGIYDIIVEPENGKAESCAFLVRIYENSNRSQTKSLGTRTIKEKTVIARVLMPEGIFWDDDSYFTGNLEDSDSITKFNSETGLVWKEFKEP